MRLPQIVFLVIKEFPLVTFFMNSDHSQVDHERLKKIEGLLRTGITTLLNLEKLYPEGDMIKKREIIGSIFPEKLTFDGVNYRTARPNEADSLIYSPGEGAIGKKRTSAKKSSCPVR